MQPIYWLVLAVLFVVIELMTTALTSIWFAGGAAAAFLAGLIGFRLPVQAGVFVAVSVILLALTRPLAARWLKGRTIRTNADSLIGRYGVVTETIDNREAKGQVQIDGTVWSARSANGAVIESGRNVRILGIRGVRLIVEGDPSETGAGDARFAEE